MILRPYQSEAVEAVYAHLRSRTDNPCVVLPTGTGKSLVIAQIVRDAVAQWNGRVLILAHVKELLEQNAGKIRALCPELKIGIFSAGLKSRDTDESVIVAGIQSVYDKACDLGAFDLIIVDEAHLIAPDGDGMYRSFLKDMKVINPNVRLIGLTATPFRLKGGLICQPENLLNGICYEAGLKEMIVQGYLSPLISKAGRAEAELDKLHVRGGEFIGDEIAEAMDRKELVERACREVIDLTRDRKSVLIFTSGITHCRHVAEQIASLSGMECAVVTGDTPPGERAEIIDRFKGKTVPADLFGTPKLPLKFLCNVNVLTTGFDAPNTDCIVLLRPTNSPGLLIQMVGRGTRLSPESGKSNCIAEGTLILTDKGLVPIENVTTEMHVWDGVEFVSHDGSVCQGEQNVINYAGISATADHKVWCGDNWRTFGSCAEEGFPISVTGHHGKAIRETDGYFRCDQSNRGIFNSAQSSALHPQKKICPDYMQMRRNCMEKLGQSSQGNCRMSCLRQTEKGATMACSKSYCGKTTLRKSSRSALSGLWRPWNSVQIQRPDRDGALANGEIRLPQQKDADRSHRQQWELRTGQCQNDYCQHQRNEYATSEQNKNVALQNETSGNPICRYNSVQVFQQGNVRRENCKKILPTVFKTKRRVWDILNAGPRHRFTAAGLLVSNCLVLDYGGNIKRHGPVDMIRVTDKMPGSGDAPVKTCPECRSIIHAAYQSCPDCGYVFPPPQKSNLTERAAKDGIISGETTTEDYEVKGVFYTVHEKRYAEPGTPRTMRVDYHIGFSDYKSEWVCPEHTGYARKKFEKWWNARAAYGCRMPASAREAVALADEGLLAQAQTITVKSVAGEKFERITNCVLGERPVLREPGDGSEAALQDMGVSDYEDDSIPF